MAQIGNPGVNDNFDAKFCHICYLFFVQRILVAFDTTHMQLFSQLMHVQTIPLHNLLHMETWLHGIPVIFAIKQTAWHKHATTYFTLDHEY